MTTNQTDVEDHSASPFITNLLAGRAAQWANFGGHINYCTFVFLLKKVFDHLIQGQKATRLLLNISQGLQSVADFPLKFCILAAESGWDQVALWGELATPYDPDSLGTHISLVISLDQGCPKFF